VSGPLVRPSEQSTAERAVGPRLQHGRRAGDPPRPHLEERLDQEARRWPCQHPPRGLVVCGACGRRCLAGYTNEQRIYRRWVWHRPKRLRDCTNKGWTAKRLEGIVWTIVAAFLDDPVTSIGVVEAQGHDTDQPELRIAQLERWLGELEAEDARVRAGFRAGTWDAAGARAELELSAKARKVIEGEVAEMRKRAVQQARLADLERAAAELRGHLPALSHEARGQALPGDYVPCCQELV